MGYACVCVLLDLNKLVCSEARVQVQDEILWQQFTYEELPDICYTCGWIRISSKTCDCSTKSGEQNNFLALGLEHHKC